MPWLVSMRMIGQVIGAPTTTAKRRSVIFSADGSDERLTLDCTSAEAASALRLRRFDERCRGRPAPATAPTDLKEPAPIEHLLTAGFMRVIP